MAIPDITTDLLARLTEHDFGVRAAVADVVDDWDGARILADGRAPDMAEYNAIALLRSAPEAVDRLLEKGERFFRKRNRHPSVWLDPLSAPDDLPDRLALRGYQPAGPAEELMLWDPGAPHIYTAPEAYMTLATNATLDAWLEIATGAMEPTLAAQARAMLTLSFRTAGFTFWFGLHDGVPAGTCALHVQDGLGQLYAIRVDPAFRGKGVGLALVNYVTRQSRKDGAEVTCLFRDPSGPGAGLCRTTGYQSAVPCARYFWTLPDERTAG